MSRNTRSREVRPEGSRSRTARHTAPGRPRAIGLTLLSALIPGSGFVMGGRAKLGAFVMTLTIGLFGLRRSDRPHPARAGPRARGRPDQLLVATGVLIFLAICWIAIIVSSHRLLRPASVPRSAGRSGPRSSGWSASRSRHRWRSRPRA